MRAMRWTYQSVFYPLTLISLIFDKREVTLTDFEKKTPSRNISTLHLYYFLRSTPPSTTRLLHLCVSFFHNTLPSTFIATSTYIDLGTFVPPLRFLQPPRLLERVHQSVWTKIVSFGHSKN